MSVDSCVIFAVRDGRRTVGFLRWYRGEGEAPPPDASDERGWHVEIVTRATSATPSALSIGSARAWLFGWAARRGLSVVALPLGSPQSPPLPAEDSGPPVLPQLRALLAEISLDAERGGNASLPDQIQRLLPALQARAEEGARAYGTLLHAHNGRDALRDAQEEALDLLQYAAQAYLEGRVDKGAALAALTLSVVVWGLVGGGEEPPDA